MMAIKKLPDDPHPEAEERFRRLLRSMVSAPPPEPDAKTQSEEDQTLDEVLDEDCGDIHKLPQILLKMLLRDVNVRPVDATL